MRDEERLLDRSHSPAPPITVHGGAGGIDADLTDMEMAAGRLGTVGADLQTMWWSASADASSVLLSTDAVTCPRTALTAELDMGAVLVGPTSLLATGLLLASLKTAVSTCKGAYEVQDALRKHGFTQFVLHGGPRSWLKRVEADAVAGGAGLLWYTATHGGELPRGQAWLDYMPLDQGTATEMVGTAQVLVLGDPALVALGMGAVTALGAAETPVRVHAAVREAPGRPPRGARDLLQKASLPTQDGKQSEIRLTRVTDAQGGHAWIVAIPGTENFGGERQDTTRDGLTNFLALLGYSRPHAMDGIRLALERQMRAVGADPAREPVMLVGHSQGGILAGRLARDDAFRRSFRVRSVMTSGAPIAGMVPPPDTHLLALEHSTDVVPGFDGRENPDKPNVTTVRRDTQRHPPADAREKLLRDGIRPGAGMKNPHRESAYLETATSVDIDRSASTERWRQESAPFLDAQSEETWTVDMTREEGQQQDVRVDAQP